MQYIVLKYVDNFVLALKSLIASDMRKPRAAKGEHAVLVSV
jgi:hypothetical protein